MSGRIVLAGLLLVFTLFTAKAQDSAALKFTESISASGIREHVYVLASDSLEGRETAKPGMQKAARYVSGEFYKMGIPPLNDGTYFQKVPFRKTMPGSLSVATNRKTFTDIQDFYSTQFDGLGQMLSAGIILAGYGIRDSASGWDDLSGITAKGKAVMIIDGTPKDKKGNVLSGKAEHNRDVRVENVSSLDPPVILWVRRDYAERRERLSRSFAGGILSLDAESTEKTIPVITISPEMADALLQSEGISLASYEKKIASRKKPVSVTVGDTLKISARPESVFCTNVLGYMEGTDKKDELVIVTAHLDHLGMRNGDIYYGADDDGSGCAAVLEMAEALSNAKKEGFAPRRSVLFMTFTGEEKGLFGSEYYVNNPEFPLENTIANLNIDMIGRVDTVNGPATGYVYVIGANRISDTLFAVNERVNRNYSGLKLDYRYNDPDEKMRLYYRSDHYSFIKKGVPSNFYFTGLHPDYHKPTDTPDKIDYEKAARIARLVFLNIWELANMPARPDVKDDR